MDTLYRWSKFVSDDRLDEWEHRLLAEEVPYVLEKHVKRQRWSLSVYTPTEEEAELLRARFGGSVGPLVPDAWMPGRAMVESPPLRIRDALVVTASDDPDTLAQLAGENPGRAILSFPHQLAFGTGGHPTTANCLRFVADFAKRQGDRPWHMLDLGCGSGILAIAAAKLGAASVLAVDNDGMALEYARQNGVSHGVEDIVEFSEGDAVALMAAAPARRYDLLAANLFSDLLEELFPRFPAHLAPGGELVISGFLESQAPAISRCADTAGLPLLRTTRRGKWMAARAIRENA